MVALALGLRQGEALGLKWEHVDLTAGLLRIRRNRLRPKYEHGCGGTCGRKAGYCPAREQVRADAGPTKSRAGRRVVGLPEPLIVLLKVHPGKQEAERTAARQLWHNEGWVFAKPDGRPLNPNTDYHEWKALIEEAGLTTATSARRTAHRRNRARHPRRADADGHGHHGMVERRPWPPDISMCSIPSARA